MKLVDLFAGCGGMSLGFSKAGFDIVGAYEFWDVAVKCYGNNFNHPVFQQDLSNVDEAVESIIQLAPDVIIGGPPCQDFSHAGKRIEADRANLTISYAKIISRIKPSFFVMENVDRITDSRTYAEARQIYKDSNYGLTEIILDASLCGVPQKRKRFFCIGGLGLEDNFLKDFILQDLSNKPMTLRDYFGETLNFEFYYRHPRNYSRRAVFSIDEPAPTMRGVNRPVPKGYIGHPNDACPLNENIRCLTTLERALIQTFPADYKWVGNKTDTEQMIGNAVPVNLAFYVGTHLMNYIQKENSVNSNIELFSDWLKSNKNFSDRTVRDVQSRIMRADRLQPRDNHDMTLYIYYLEHNPQYLQLSSSVKSQIKRALNLFDEFIKNKNESASIAFDQSNTQWA